MKTHRYNVDTRMRLGEQGRSMLRPCKGDGDGHGCDCGALEEALGAGQDVAKAFIARGGET